MNAVEELEYLRDLARQKGLWGPHLVIRVPVKVGGAWVVELFNDLYGGMGEAHTHDTIWIGQGATLNDALQSAVRAAEKSTVRGSEGSPPTQEGPK